jgi:hypothetical protein
MLKEDFENLATGFNDIQLGDLDQKILIKNSTVTC